MEVSHENVIAAKFFFEKVEKNEEQIAVHRDFHMDNFS